MVDTQNHKQLKWWKVSVKVKKKIKKKLKSNEHKTNRDAVIPSNATKNRFRFPINFRKNTPAMVPANPITLTTTCKRNRA